MLLQFHCASYPNNLGQYFCAEVEGKIVGHAFLEPLSLSAISHIASLTIVAHFGWQERDWKIIVESSN